ncbi:Hsp20/alpha crystallin family protein [Adhaeribacter terreus]|uniref:Hsp20/alpha crystallin family protein n=1 Tax=Adhaeribacter terreus TaxID=529703 RepID=A0ABW0E9D0_9BACT
MADETTPSSFSSMLDRFFNDSLNSRKAMASFTPHVDTSETDEAYEIEVSLPGLKKEEIDIDFQDGRLTISGERKFSDEKRTKKYHMLESQYGSFMRSFYLPDTINSEAIDAEFEDGVLRINVPKETRKIARKQIQIKGASDKKNAENATKSSSGNGKQKR